MNILRMFFRLRTALLFAAGLAFVVLLVAFQSLHLWSYDLRIPLDYSGDSLIQLMYIKGLLQDGWPTTITHLSAPFAYSGAAFPLLTSVDWLIINILSMFTTEPGHLLNVFWLLTLVLSAWFASYAAYQLGLSKKLSFISAVLYAFLPFALMSNVVHLNLVYYPVPLLCLLSVIISGGGAGVRNVKQAKLVGLFACVIQGFNYIYYSFFAVLLFGVSALISYKRDGFRLIKLPLLAIALVILTTAMNLLPAFQSWQKYGAPPDMGHKTIKDAEIFGAKLRRMLSPHPNNPILPLAKIAQKADEAQFPNENENRTARLGLYGAFGLLLIIVSMLRLGRGGNLSQPTAAISSLGLAIILISTVGGFGSVINLLTVPDIRCYNRFSVYLSFFVITATGLWLEDKLSRMNSRWRMVGHFIICGFFLLSLYDQLLEARPLVAQQQSNIRSSTKEKMDLKRLEQVFPTETAIMQLPFTIYPPLVMYNKMGSYDHVRPFIWSNHLKWSWPSFSQRHRAWQSKLGTFKGIGLIRAAIFSGFGAIWIDRSAYQDDGRDLVSSLVIGKVKPVEIGNNRFAVLDIREEAANLKASMPEAEFKQHASDFLDNVLVEWKRGFFDEEKTPEGESFRWSEDRSEIGLRNPYNESLTTCISFVIGTDANGFVQVDGADSPIKILTSAGRQSVKIHLNLMPGGVRSLRFSSGLPQVYAPKDPRRLYFYVMDFDVSVSKAFGITQNLCE